MKDFLPQVIQALECFVSERDIQAGSDWPARLASELANTSFGILCLNRSNLAAPWLFFEAGAIWKAIPGTRVCPYLFDLGADSLPAPLKLFQAKIANEDGTKDLVQALNNCLETRKLEDVALDNAFNRCWHELRNKFNGIRSATVIEEKHRSDREILEEVLSIIRASARPTLCGSRRNKAIVVDVEGGFLAGKRLIGDTDDTQMEPFSAVNFYHLTHQGSIGKRFQTATPRALEVMQASRDIEEIRERLKSWSDEESSQYYEVTARFEDDFMVYFQLNCIPRPSSSQPS